MSSRTRLRGRNFLNTTVEPPCATTSHKRSSIQKGEVFEVKAIYIELLVKDHLSRATATATTFYGEGLIFHRFQPLVTRYS